MRRQWISRGLLLAGLLATAALAGAAEPYPSRPVKVIANMAAGGGTDTIARIFSEQISRQLGQPVVVENRAGAAGQIGTELAAVAPADGYTFLFASSSLLSLPYLRPTRYELLKDFEPVGQVGIGGFVLVVNPKLPFKTLAEFMTAVKANPGKYTFGSPGIGSAGHLGLYLLKAKSGVEMVHVPFKSSTEVAQALISGQIDCAVDIVPIQKSYIDAQSVRALATTGPARDPSLPQLPTFNESKLVPGGYELTFWYGMFAPRATPPAVLKRAQEAFATVLQDPAVQERVKGFSVVPSQFTAADFRRSIAAETEQWRKIIKDNNITLDN
ncbi:hypothetical protein C7T35_21245 [Variovorax sp. WS11]|uniref:Bug family tripartite tricarboxylate transporter substrate binding protein n=1 Tax=Variovorax sp. WS11 TaxID=1105204 RepID=UPI000D0CB3DF|nr:tripartite tricarboxylate transporter substrate binding protein [Variovorax sp. WS11]NDZ18757.1 tripartite tricarboxylate transporter substrate binding protein [Variovorax sp. WS11]PSL82536.1 hypothetical protein C7T35_21245 [Variovorax sp. WS11]